LTFNFHFSIFSLSSFSSASSEFFVVFFFLRIFSINYIYGMASTGIILAKIGEMCAVGDHPWPQRGRGEGHQAAEGAQQ
jgi:hypothetical protein